MTRRFTVSVTDFTGRIIDRWVQFLGTNPSTLVGRLVEDAIDQKLKSGEIPRSWGGVAEPNQSAIAFLRQLVSGEECDPDVEEAVARELGIAPEDLRKALQKNADG